MLTYELPAELIAQTPCEPRDLARLAFLNKKTGEVSHRVFRDLEVLLEPGDCLVLNDTKVLPARLLGQRADTGGKVELLLLGIQKSDDCRRQERFYRCLGQPGKRLKPGSRLVFNHGSVRGEVISSLRGEKVVRFEGSDIDKALDQLGEVPLPPYIRRPVESRDTQWYQTVYARTPGAVAAPTAGLHFTQGLLNRIQERGVRITFLTLHVGWGTFKPVSEGELESGRLHPEQFRIPPEAIQAIEETKINGGRVIAVGTTVVRTLESWRGGWVGPNPPPAPDLSVATRPSIEGTTELFIRPGFEFRVVDAIVTNFHLPGTSLLELVSAFAGEERILAAYREAIRTRYRFYSYGDAMFIQ